MTEPWNPRWASWSCDNRRSRGGICAIGAIGAIGALAASAVAWAEVSVPEDGWGAGGRKTAAADLGDRDVSTKLKNSEVTILVTDPAPNKDNSIHIRYTIFPKPGPDGTVGKGVDGEHKVEDKKKSQTTCKVVIPVGPNDGTIKYVVLFDEYTKGPPEAYKWKVGTEGTIKVN